jgi:hypothetical protein
MANDHAIRRPAKARHPSLQAIIRRSGDIDS